MKPPEWAVNTGFFAISLFAFIGLISAIAGLVYGLHWLTLHVTISVS